MGNADIRFYATILLRRLPYVLGIVVLLTGAGVVAAYMMPSIYQATAKILVEPPQIPADMARPTVQVHPVEQLQIIQQVITTRENLLDLAERLDIYGADRPALSDDDIVEDLRERTTLELIHLDRPSDARSATLFSISFISEQPVLAARVVNELAAFVLEKNLGLRTGRAEDTMQFFDRAVAGLGQELAAREEEVLLFKNAHKNALPDSIEFRRTQQNNQEERLLLLEREESTLRARRNNLVRMFEVTGQIAGSGPASPEQELLRDLKRALSEQLSIFSDDSPNVVGLRTRIAALQDQLHAEEASADAGQGPSELDFQLSDIDERLGFIEREKKAIAGNLEELRRTIEATPQNETTLNALERARDNVKAQYNGAVAKLAEASTGEQIELRAKGGSFSLVEPATPPENRISPDRRRIAAMGLMAGVAAGLGFVVLLELANRTIRRPVELARAIQAQPLAAIPYIRLPDEKTGRKRKRALLAAANVAGTGLAGLGKEVRRWNIY